MAKPAAHFNPGPSMNLGGLSAPVSDTQLTDEQFAQAHQQELRAGQQQAVEAPQLPPLQRRTSHDVVDDDEPLPPALELPDDISLDELQARIERMREARKKHELVMQLREEYAKLQEQEAARAAATAYNPVRDSPSTFILMPESAPEAQLAEDWVAEHCPVKLDQGAVVTTIDLAMLRPDDAVICMVRGKGKRNPLTRNTFVTTHEGERLTQERPKEELFAQMVLTEPVHCGDHWIAGGGQRGGRVTGRLNFASFMEAIGKVCTPLAPRRSDATNSKDGMEPRMLVLREL